MVIWVLRLLGRNNKANNSELKKKKEEKILKNKIWT